MRTANWRLTCRKKLPVSLDAPESRRGQSKILWRRIHPYKALIYKYFAIVMVGKGIELSDGNSGESGA